ncbi:MAG: Uma2 family endonuclease [Bryobacterales bacterium]|nr:Uma2 family endonuclease [Bryobacterales bacterium]
MAIPQVTLSTLTTGDRLSREEFLRIWDGLPSLKNAELIDGVVYVASPVSQSHWSLDVRMIGVLRRYAIYTPGCQAGNNGTWLMLESAPQPDSFLRILPAYHGQSRDGDHRFPSGAPELAVEVCVTSTEIDFGRKLALYQRAGVREYVTVEDLNKRLLWRRLQPDGSYAVLEPGPDGVIRSQVFPGLWLNVAAFWADNGISLERTLDAGLASPEHAEFVHRLA